MNKEKYHWLRSHPEYIACMTKITSYKKGFEWYMNWSIIPKAKVNALKIILSDASEKGIIEIIEDEWGFDEELNFINTGTRYKRL